jgi:hypothetical protein
MNADKIEWHRKSFEEIRAYVFERYKYPRDAAEKLIDISYDIIEYVESLNDEAMSDQEFLRWDALIQKVTRLGDMYEQMAVHGNAELPPIPEHGRRGRPTKAGSIKQNDVPAQEAAKAATPIINIDNTIGADGIRYALHDVVGIKIAAKILDLSVSYLYEMNKKSYKGRKPKVARAPGTRKLSYRVSDLVAFRDGTDTDIRPETEEEQTAMNLRAVEMAREMSKRGS